MIAFIDDQRTVHGVEPICKVLPIAPSTYFDHQAKRADPDLLSDRAKRDALLLPEIKRVHKEHFEVYGAQKLWRQLGREGFSVARLMRANGIEGAVRGKPLRTTFSDKGAPCPKDHVNREFQAAAPNRLWVSDFGVFVWSHFPSRQAFHLA
jgi:putative transposase